MPLDLQQTQAATTTGSDIVVSASAGAGKTSVLVSRLIKRCLKDRVGMDEILAVTFTEAAASEMKARVAMELNKALENAETEDEKKWISEQLVLLADADITTIDSFCLNLLRKYYNVIGLDPGACLNVLDEGQITLLMQSSFKQALATIDQENRIALLKTLRIFSPRSEDYGSLCTIVSRLMETYLAQSRPDEWMKKQIELAGDIQSLEDLPEAVRTEFFHYLDLNLAKVIESYDMVIAKAQEKDLYEKDEEKFKACYNRLHGLKNHLDRGNYALYREAVLSSFGKEDKLPAYSKIEEYSAARTAFGKALNTMVSELASEEQLVQSHNSMSDVRLCLLRCCALMADAYQNAKKDLPAIDFTDMERLAYQIVTANGGEVARVFQSRLKEVMVDEFQDTSPLQDEIIKAISAKGTIFRVGDVKQSIYRFRGAEPRLMSGYMEDPSITQITLCHNYRSCETIVSFCNAFFSRLMNLKPLVPAYTDRDIVSIGVDAQRRKDPEPVCFVWVKQPKRGEAGRKNSKVLKAEWIAFKIKDLVENHHEQYKDCCVLLRGHADKIHLRRAFDLAGIPYEIDARQGFYNAEICRILKSLCEVLLDPTNTIALCAVVLSDLFGLCDEDLASVKLSHKDLAEGIYETWPKISSSLAHFKKTAMSKGLLAFLNEVGAYNDFYEKLDHTQRNNFDMLFEKTISIAQREDTLYALLSDMIAGEAEKSSEAQTRAADSSLVTVTTIHQSKGLQYRNVFLWSTMSNPNNEAKDPVLYDEEMGLGVFGVDPTLSIKELSATRIACLQKSNLADCLEATRLLYVALTRPVERLWIVEAGEEEKRPHLSMDPSWTILTARTGFTGMLLSTMPAPYRDENGKILFDVVSVAPAQLSDGQSLTQSHVQSLTRWKEPTHPRLQVLKPSETESDVLAPLDVEHRRIKGTGYGTRMHKALEVMNDEGLTEKIIAEFELTEHECAHLSAFLNSDLYKTMAKGQLHREYPFFTIDEKTHRILTGVLDLISFQEDTITICDYKTDACSSDELRTRYSAQLSLYVQAMRLAEPNKKVQAYFYSLHLDEAIPL